MKGLFISLNSSLKILLLAGLLVFGWLFYCHAQISQVRKLSDEEKKKVFKPKLDKASFDERMVWLEKEVGPRVKDLLNELNRSDRKMALVVYKKSRELELWTDKEPRKKLKTYKLTAYSGVLGPKNREGDLQIPEGVYKITHFNPNSRYYLSLGVNYPNANDQKRAEQNKISSPGGDIFIHGRQNTVGCISIGDHYIEEIFYLAAKLGVSNARVLISPTRPPLPSLKSLGIDESPLINEKYSELTAELIHFN